MSDMIRVMRTPGGGWSQRWYVEACGIYTYTMTRRGAEWWGRGVVARERRHERLRAINYTINVPAKRKDAA